MKKIILPLLILASTSANAYLPEHCGSIKNHYGPYDYTSPADFSSKLPIVEAHHFTSKVERLIGGQSGALVNDLDYTLRTFPNHHRALNAMMKYQLRLKEPITQYNQTFILTMDCYFLRADYFKYNRDPNVLMLHGMYKYKLGKIEESIEKYNQALKINPKSSQLHYNIGLAYFSVKNYEKSKYHADVSYGIGFPLQGLKNKLKGIN